MKLMDVMKPWGEEEIFCDGLLEEQEVYSLQVEQIREMPDRINIVDRNKRRTGQMKREILEAILTSADQYDVGGLMDTFEEGIVALNEKGIIFYANEMYSKILGVPVGKILGRSMYEIEPSAALLTVLQTKRPMKVEHQYVQTLGRYVSCRITPIYRNGIFRGARSVFSDATELVKLSAEIQRVSQVASDLQQRVNVIDNANSMELVGKSPGFVKVISQAAIVAPTDAPVMIRGENGTGKEVLAKFIHANSRRAEKPLITVNCASIPENLVESELFGYEEGAFTGAVKGGRMGKFQMADGGTLFLDEIGDMPILMQTKLLRAIQENEIEKVGGKNVKVDVRIITATNQPLEQMIEDKTFRRDLYYRINTVTLRIPPLRERREDILQFAEHFLKKYNRQYGKEVLFSESVLRWFLSHSWPGNVREMKNCIENGVILCGSSQFDLDWLLEYRRDRGEDPKDQELWEIPEDRGPEGSTHMGAVDSPGLQPQGRDALWENLPMGKETLYETMFRLEGELLGRALKTCGGNRREAMALLGLSRRTFYRKLSEHSLTARIRD